ncbi:MAG TPA: hypothetical protein VNE40_01155 [Candidatus Dormibacteraeota bacterium]|nr:hypothetical protein [Candidatus Dormibacteraeota bacterium]
MVKRSSAGMPTEKFSNESIIAHFSDGLLMHFTSGETIINGLDEPGGGVPNQRRLC